MSLVPAPGHTERGSECRHQGSRSVYTSHSPSGGSGAGVKSQRGQAVTSPASSPRWEGLVGTQSAAGRAPHGHCSQAVRGGCSSVVLAPWALVLTLLLHGSQPELAGGPGAGDAPQHGGRAGAHTRPAMEPERAGSSEAPSPLAEAQPWCGWGSLSCQCSWLLIQGLSSYLCSSKGEGEWGCVCSIAWT